MRIAQWGVMILVALPAGIAGARQPQQTPQKPSEQQQEDPLAAAARRAREQKKDQPKASKVWDNDNIPMKPGSVSVVGQAAAPAENATNQAATAQVEAAVPSDAGKGGLEPGEKAAAEAALAAAKEQLKSLQADLDVLQRKFTLDQQTYYGKPDYASDKAGAKSLKDEQDQIDAKKQEVADAQKRVGELQAKSNTPSDDQKKNTPN